MTTTHIAAEAGQIAPTVLLPGDPNRAKRMAEAVLTDATLVNDIRGALAFTGSYEGKPLSIMASGMGMPSATLYATELIRFFDVKRIIRVGTCGGIGQYVELGDVIIAHGAHADSAINVDRLPGMHYSAIADWQLVAGAVAAAQQLDGVHVGAVLSQDHFYEVKEDPKWLDRLATNNVLGVEMEAAGIYGAASANGAQALAVLTVSNIMGNLNCEMSPAERETRFAQALQVALGAAFV